jgi:hypothetical protein
MCLPEGVMGVALAWQTCHLFGGHGACLVDVPHVWQTWCFFGGSGPYLADIASGCRHILLDFSTPISQCSSKCC